MTYHSAKGLQFDVVILPLFKGMTSDNDRRKLYVAMTRTMGSLYVLYNTPSIPSPLNSVPLELYLKK
jgi:superfamily I DNA/RNA helicase